MVILAVKAAVKTLSLKVDELLIDYHFHHSIKRIESLKDYTNFCMEYTQGDYNGPGIVGDFR